VYEQASIHIYKGPRYSWAVEKLRVEYKYERFGVRNKVERFSRYLKERIMVFHHKLSAGNRIQGIINLKLFLNLFTIYYQIVKMEGGE
jgi:hypothetical protein